MISSSFREVMRSIKASILITVQKNKTTVILTAFLLGLVLMDQAVKYAFIRWLPSTSGDTGPGFSLSGVFNEGLVLNLQIRGMDFVFGVLIFTLLLITLLFFYVAGLRWLSESFHIIKVGITVLCGGVFSNLLDKIRHGRVLDFIKFQLSEESGSLFFNTADIFQTIGWIILIYGVIKLRKQIWRSVERRGNFLIHDMHIQKYQVEFISYVLWIMICVGLSIFLISHKLTDVSGTAQPLEQSYLISTFVTYYFVIYVIFTLLIMGVTVYFSNRIYGPIYAVQKYLKAILNGENPSDLKLRKGDQFKEMQELMSQLKNRTNQNPPPD